MSAYQTTACAGKEPIDSAPLAKKIARRQTKRYGFKFNAYRCRACGSFHTGSEQPRRKFEPLTPEEEFEWSQIEKLNGLRKRNRT